jgi:integrase
VAAETDGHLFGHLIALAKLLRACTPTEEARVKFYLMLGFREAEGRFVTWRDVDFKHMAVRVTAKPHWGFQPKNWEEREVPVPQKLITLLQKYRPHDAEADAPVFPSATYRPGGAVLEKLKAVAERAKLNCGHCATQQELKEGGTRINRCAEGPYCSRWFLHKFRHTYATRHLQDGIDIRTLQQCMGHRDIASTMSISRVCGTGTFRPESTRALWQLSLEHSPAVLVDYLSRIALSKTVTFELCCWPRKGSVCSILRHCYWEQLLRAWSPRSCQNQPGLAALFLNRLSY